MKKNKTDVPIVPATKTLAEATIVFYATILEMLGVKKDAIVKHIQDERVEGIFMQSAGHSIALALTIAAESNNHELPKR